MADKNLITTSGLQEVKTAEGELAFNLFTHANSSLSKAHGWEFLDLPHPFLDATGNDVSIYTDSHGDRVGYYQMQLTYNGVNYYAGLEASVLAGQPASANIVLTSRSQLAIQDGTAWITKFNTHNESNLIVTNDDVLIPHTRLGHWQSHTGNVYSVIPQVVKDSAGHTVSEFIARISFGGKELWIPVQPRLGGPLQPIRLPKPGITVARGANLNVNQMSADDAQFTIFFFNAPTGGTLPYTLKWQFNTYQPIHGLYWADPLVGSGTWVDLPYTTVALPIPAGNPEAGIYAMTPPDSMTMQVSAGSNTLRTAATVRALYTNAAGTVTSNWCLFLAADSDGSWVFSGPETNQNVYYANITNDPVWTDGYYL